MSVPYWVQDAIFYQIFPDRFANGDLRNDPVNVDPWGSSPTMWNFMGGDLRGIITNFDYLLELGVTAIYLNPIFQSPSNHRYNTTDYYRIDPKLGDMVDFQSLLRVAHQNGVRIILDGVFNHSGRGFFAFNDILENQEHSPYLDWYHIKRFPVSAYSAGITEDYLAWWGIASLPKFNTDNPAVRKYLLDVSRYWLEQGADGWRLDVPNEIDDDEFWSEFRQVVKSANRDAYLVGEIWTADARWVGDDHFDGLMNYPLRDALLEFLGTGFLSAKEFADQIEALLTRYPRENVYAMYLPLGSHDTERLFSLLDKNVDKVKLAFALQFAYPGAPAIYYGDEFALPGGKDPDCRRAFPWKSEERNEELLGWVKQLISLRKQHSVLRRGDFKRVFVEDKHNVYAFARTLNMQALLVAINASTARRQVRIPLNGLGFLNGQEVHNLLGGERYIIVGEDLALDLPPWGVVWIA